MIVDTHTHTVSDDQERYPRKVAPHGVNWVRDMPVSAEKMIRLADEAGIDRVMLMQALGAYEYDNSYCVDSGLRYPERLLAVAIIDVEKDGVEDRARYWVKERGAKGMRLIGGLPTEPAWPDPQRVHSFWKAAADLGVPICAITLAQHIPNVRRLAEQFPQVPVALDHMAFPDVASGPPYAGARPLFDLARLPNIYLKFSTPSLDRMREVGASPKEFFSRLIDRFGPHRLMWGTNFSATYDRTPREQLLYAQETLSFLSTAEQRLVFGESAASVWPGLAGKAR